MEKEKQKKKKDTVFISYIKDRIFNRNKNFFMIFTGSVGSGKSYSALRLAELLDDSFYIDRCCFKAIDFMRKIKELQEQKARAGTVVIWDELGVEHSAREFMTISNRVINYFFQTSRYLNLIVLMTVPMLSFIDSNTRKLAHCIAETTGINSRDKTVSVKAKMLQVNPLTSKEYPKFLRYKKQERKFVLKKLKFPLPSPELREAYEKKKREFSTWLYEDSLRRLERVEEKDNRAYKPLSPMQEKVTELLRNNNAEQVAKILNMNIRTIYQHKKEAEKKGIVFKPIWENNKVICYEIEGLRHNSLSNTATPQL